MDRALTLQQIAAEPYERRGILHSEMALIIETCQRLGVKAVVESGRARGQSTYMLAKYMPDVAVHSVELRDHPDEAFVRERLARFENVSLYCGDGNTLVPMIARQQTVCTAILCDGPKGAAAVNIIAKCFELPHVAAGFVHDMRKLDHGGPSPHRAYALERFPNARFSDDPKLDRLSWLDANVAAAGGPCGPAHVAEFGSYGPTVGVFLNPLTSK